MAGKTTKGTKKGSKDAPPFETDELRKGLRAFLQMPYDKDSTTGKTRAIGSFKWGVYIFYDYDGEPIYVGQAKAKISDRIGRHLTNQRTDAVAMSVLDPFEVFRVRVYPLLQFEGVNSKHPDYKTAKNYVDALEFEIHKQAQAASEFKAILNEKDPEKPKVSVTVPRFLEGRIVSEKVFELRSHADARIARRAQTIARLAQTISEREVKNGLRRTMVTQAKRLQWLSEQKFLASGGEGAVERGPEESEDETKDET